MLKSLWAHRGLSKELAKREVLGRYRGSTLGLAWSFLTPLVLLVVYTLFFTEVFQARWGSRVDGGKLDFASAAFVGLIVHGFFSESAVRGAGVLLSNPNFVKKIVFPLDVLPWVSVLASLFHALVSVAVLLVVLLVLGTGFSATAWLWPLMLLPMLLAATGTAWLLSSLAVYFRDVGQVVGFLATVFLFTSPVFFAIDTLPDTFRTIVAFNPLTYLMEQSRELLLWGGGMDWSRYARYTLIALAFAWLCHAFFQRSKRGFADVI